MTDKAAQKAPPIARYPEVPAPLHWHARASRRLAPVLLLAPVSLVLLLFFVLPFCYNFLDSLQPSPIIGGQGPSLANYVKLATDSYYLGVLLRTFVLGLSITVLCFLLGYPCAYFIARSNSRLKGFYIFMVISPLVVSIIIRTFGWLVLLGKQGLINSLLLGLGIIHQPLTLVYNWTGVVIALTHVLLPYMILSIAAVLENLPRNVEEAARVLGASPWQAFLRVTLPLSFEGIGTGAILVFMLTVGSFVTVLLLGGTETMVLPLLIYQQVSVTADERFASALGTVLLLVGLATLYLQTRLFRVRGAAS